jgi:ABC-type phosphate transport system permease subunit
LWLRQPIGFLVDLLAAIPSVVYGLWGIFVLIPLLRTSVMPFLRDTLHLGSTPFFAGPAYGPSMLAAGIILAIMALPYIPRIARGGQWRSLRSRSSVAGSHTLEMISRCRILGANPNHRGIMLASVLRKPVASPWDWQLR